jgi:hypothetical protein
VIYRSVQEKSIKLLAQSLIVLWQVKVAFTKVADEPGYGSSAVLVESINGKTTPSTHSSHSSER